MIDEITIKELSPEALLRLSDRYACISEKLRAAAREKAAALSCERDTRNRLSEIRAIADVVAGYEATGMSRDAAIRSAGIAAGVDARCVEAHMIRADRKAKGRARQARDADIIRLRAKGLSARQIADRTGLHYTTVAKISRRSPCS